MSEVLSKFHIRSDGCKQTSGSADFNLFFVLFFFVFHLFIYFPAASVRVKQT